MKETEPKVTKEKEVNEERIEIWGDSYINANFYFLNKKKKLIAVSDLHLGFEEAIIEEGIYLPPFQIKIVMEKLRKIIKKEKPKIFLINGDLKHEFARTLYVEVKEIRNLLEYLTSKVKEVVLVRGNHDNFIKGFIKSFGIEFLEQFETEDILFVHGHKKIKKIEGRVVIGHEHPSIRFRDEVGGTVSFPCFLKGRIGDGELLVLPAFSPLSTGSDILSIEKERFLCPILREKGVDDFQVYVATENIILNFKSVRKLKEVLQTQVKQSF